jgi:hypothetical protein
MSNLPHSEGATIEIRTRGFSQARILPGTATINGIQNAGICLIRADDRTIRVEEMVPANDYGGHLDHQTLRFFRWLTGLELVSTIAIVCNNGLMVASVCLVPGTNNPTLALLNKLRERAGEELLSSTILSDLLGIPDELPVPHPHEISPQAALLTVRLEQLIVTAANTALTLPPAPAPR